MKIIVFGAMLLLCNLAYGRVNKDAYEKAVDYLNCKTVELSLKEIINLKDNKGNPIPKYKENHENYVKNVPCDKDISLEKITTYFNGIEGYAATKALSKEIETLKKSFKQDWKPEDAATFLSEGVFNNNNYPKLVDFAKKRKNNPDFTPFKEDLKKNLIALLSEGPSTNVNSNVNNNSNADSNVNSNSNVPPPLVDPFYYTFLISCFSFLLSAAAVVTYLVFFRIRLTTLNSRLDSLQNLYNSLERKVSNQNNPQKTTGKVVTTSNSNSDEINELKSEIVRLNHEVGLLTTKRENSTTSSDAAYHRQHDQQVNTKPVREVLYFSTPNEDGSFNEKFAHTSYRQDASIYKLTKTSRTEAEFQINESESSVKLALEYPDKNIDPVCEAQNAYNPRASRIVTVQGGLGQATLDGDKWKVNKKAKIRYET